MFHYKQTLAIALLLFGLAKPAFAQETEGDVSASEVDNAEASLKKKHIPKTGPVDRHWNVRPNVVFWQENIKVKSGPDSANMQTQSEGLLVDVGYSITPYRSRWRQIYGFQFGNGRVKGKGNTFTIPDELRGQTWLILGLSASLMYRSSSNSELGLIAPFQFRTINWAIKSGSALDPDRDTSFSLGGGLVYLLRFSKQQSVHISMVKHFLWDATMWSAGYQIEFL